VSERANASGQNKNKREREREKSSSSDKKDIATIRVSEARLDG
jgi:hypothetical protein